MPKQPALLTQPIPNLNRKIIAFSYQDDQDNTVRLTAIDCNDIQLISKNKLFELAPPMITKIIDDEGR